MPKRITQCPIARSLERVGDEWSVLILRDALYGLTRFDEFQKSLGIAPNILTRRLASLVEAGMLERRQYSEHPPRFDYFLTEAGRDFRMVVLAMVAWGNRHFADGEPATIIVDAKTGAIADPILVDKNSGRPLIGSDFKVIAGPGANESMRRRLQTVPTSAFFEEFPNEQPVR